MLSLPPLILRFSLRFTTAFIITGYLFTVLLSLVPSSFVVAEAATSFSSSFPSLWNESILLEEIKRANDYLAQDIDNFINALDYADGVPRDHPVPSSSSSEFISDDHPSSTMYIPSHSSSFPTEDDYVRAGNGNPHSRPPEPSASTLSPLLRSGILSNYSTVNVPVHGVYTNLTIGNSKALALSLLFHRVLDSTKDYIEGIIQFILSNINALSGSHYFTDNHEDDNTNMYSTGASSSSSSPSSPSRTRDEQKLLLELLTLKIWPNIHMDVTKVMHSLPIINVPQTACNKWLKDIFQLNLPLLAHRSQTGTILAARRMPHIIQPELPSLCSSHWYVHMGAKMFRLSLWMILSSIHFDIYRHSSSSSSSSLSLSNYSPRPIVLFPDIHNRSVDPSFVPVTTILQTDPDNYHSLQFLPPSPVGFDPLLHSSTGIHPPPTKGSLGYIHGLTCIDKEGNLALTICKPLWRSIDSKYAVPSAKDREYDNDVPPIREAKESGYGNPGGPSWEEAPVIDIPSSEQHDDDETDEESIHEL